MAFGIIHGEEIYRPHWTQDGTGNLRMIIQLRRDGPTRQVHDPVLSFRDIWVGGTGSDRCCEFELECFSDGKEGVTGGKYLTRNG